MQGCTAQQSCLACETQRAQLTARGGSARAEEPHLAQHANDDALGEIFVGGLLKRGLHGQMPAALDVLLDMVRRRLDEPIRSLLVAGAQADDGVVPTPLGDDLEDLHRPELDEDVGRGEELDLYTRVARHRRADRPFRLLRQLDVGQRAQLEPDAIGAVERAEAVGRELG